MDAQVIIDLKAHASEKRAKASAWFFKTGKGQYGEGDRFIGVRVPDQRTVAQTYYRSITLPQIKHLLDSSVHEYRLTAVIMLVYKFQNEKDEAKQTELFDFYLANRDRVNNWDLVDSSAHHIVGAHLWGKNTSLLTQLAHSPSVWDRRIAMIATAYWIQKGEAQEAIRIATILLQDEHDLIQKAVGWMLREVGKRCDETTLTNFLDEHYRSMPRTALRYAIERLSPAKKGYYMKK